MLEYRMSKQEVLEQVYPDEVGFLLEQADARNATMFREMTLAFHADPDKNLLRLGGRPTGGEGPGVDAGPVDYEKGAMQLAAWAGDMNMVRRIMLYKRAGALMKAAENG